MSRALLILDHGSRRPEAHDHLEQLAARVRERAPSLRVYIAHLEIARPSLEEAVDQAVAAGVSDFTIYPLFLAPGRHLREDVPAQVRRATARHPELKIRVTEPLGCMPELADLIIRAL